MLLMISTFKECPAAYIIPFDIHPTSEGHEALALLADSKLQSIGKKSMY